MSSETSVFSQFKEDNIVLLKEHGLRLVVMALDSCMLLRRNKSQAEDREREKVLHIYRKIYQEITTKGK